MRTVLSFTCHHQIKAKCLQKSHTAAPSRFVHASERLIQQNKARGVWCCGVVMRRGGGHLRDREHEGLLSTGARPVTLSREAFPATVLMTFSGEGVPAAVIESSEQLFGR